MSWIPRHGLDAMFFRGLICAGLLTSVALMAQVPSVSPGPLSFEQVKAAAGSSPSDPGPLASDLSPELTQPAIQQVMGKVANWQLVRAEGKFNQDWTYTPLYLGLLAASKTTADPRYHDAVLRISEQFGWKLLPDRPFHADDESIAQVYEALYQEDPKPTRTADTEAAFRALLLRPDDPTKDLWWWCDALFMAPAGLAKLSQITGDARYLEKMNAEWALTEHHLYDPSQHLFSRDATFLDKKETNGQKLFWSRGNGWVMAGLVNVLQAMPASDRSRSHYEQLFRDMASRIAQLQGADGLWRPGLLDAAAYKQPEISGSAFFTYALAWGMNHGLLDQKIYEPVVAHAWRGMLGHIYADGRLGSIQPIGAAPDAFTPSSSYVYGVGAFLLAGSELAEGSSATKSSAGLKTDSAPTSPGSDQYSEAQLLERAQQMVGKGQVDPSGVASITLNTYEGHSTMLTVRTKSGGAEVHQHFNDIFIVLNGQGTEITGGVIVSPHTVSAGEVRGDRIEGGESHRLSKGDILHISPGTPHQLLITPGQKFIYYVVKIEQN